MLDQNIPIILNINNNIEFSYKPDPAFGTVMVPLLMWFDFDNEKERPSRIFIDNKMNLSLSPFCSAIHYGQTIFEGLKVFRLQEGEIGVFRLDSYAKRFANSARKMAMASFPEELFAECIKLYLRYAEPFVPWEQGHSLYLRPVLMANDPVIKVNPAKNYRFMIMASIVGNYFTSGSVGSKVLVGKQFVRAFPGGTGDAKTAANYAVSLQALEFAKQKGYEQVLYLDPIAHAYFEELGGMNFFLVKEGGLITPKLNGQILPGITRDSILKIASELNIKFTEKDYSLQEFLSDYSGGKISEVFASGTAAVISPIAEIGIMEGPQSKVQSYTFKQGSLSKQIKQYLEDSQRAQTKLGKEWVKILSYKK